ncbi:hypothetical protein P175DRAFT_0451630 [Aspergillus ochraceoroseus IBT 24754]|uniref:Polynucleotide 5'-hydroxyl-kinase GRC3 n=2 Tax=Aspergillus ochraceoroseus TaxID=138278 RepID=A0A2T5M9H3_9EURO|nr:uncharacterized protein P175DRAFT_0451630 [Aspergillus ochraceoroseus IBT 24754]PTU25177.1 hypothetical protein P175DRAFT_0451630 [Aspergillus ochraceoroseus IBT 24754]
MSLANMKRKAEKHQAAAPVSAFAARKARQQQAQAQAVEASVKPAHTESAGEPPSKKPRRSLDDKTIAQPIVEERQTRSQKQKALKTEEVPLKKNEDITRKARDRKPEPVVSSDHEEQGPSDEGSEDEDAIVEEAGVMSVSENGDGYESPADTPVQTVEFPLSKARLNKNNIVYSDEDTLCVRIREKLSFVLIGQYDLWVKRGVVSLMGAKLHPSPRVYRVYAPSTHSLPVLKCVSGVDGAAEVEFKSCHSGIYRLRELSPLYQRVWNHKNTPADKLSLQKVGGASKRTFSVLHTSGDDPLNRHLRPLHMEKQWSAAIKSLSQRGGRLQVLICGPKASGKSTFGRYLLNHLLSPAPQTESQYRNTDGVAFLDLDPGQPEFSPMGQIYLAHLRSPVFGPPFTHPALDSRREGTIIRAHHIGATSPKEDPDHYVLAATNLLEHYRALLASYPQCPLIINYPGWIFGLGLEVATYLVRSLGLSDVVYMSEKGPMEVVEPLSQAARAAKTALTILPSQPTEFVSRSSAQLRSMQMQSYFHLSHPTEIANPLWLEGPVSRTKPFLVHYAGPKQGIYGIMGSGSQISPDLLAESLEGALVAVVAVESPTAIPVAGPTPLPNSHHHDDYAGHDEMDMDAKPSTTMPTLESNITRTSKEHLPYLFVGAGSSTPLDPKSSRSLGLAIVRSIKATSHQLELITPIPGSQIRGAVEQGHGIVLVRGLLDNPNWAISEEYYLAQAAERRFRSRVRPGRHSNPKSTGDLGDEQVRILGTLQDRIRRAQNVPWMTVVEDRRHVVQRGQEGALWKLRKKAYPDSGSEAE